MEVVLYFIFKAEDQERRQIANHRQMFCVGNGQLQQAGYDEPKTKAAQPISVSAHSTQLWLVGETSIRMKSLSEMLIGSKTKSDGTKLSLDFVDPPQSPTLQQW